MNILVAIIVFSLLILFHELGHFTLAKLNGIRVNEFSLGLGPTIIGFTKGETKYSLKLLPFGGACMMEGEDENSDDERAFNKKGVWARISVVAAGPIFNFIMAVLFSFIVFCAAGVDTAKISDVIDGYAAQEAGLQGGDTIISMGGKDIHFYRQISLYATFHEGEPVEVVFTRDVDDGIDSYVTTLVPKYDEESGRYLYGFISSGEREKLGLFENIKYAFYELGYYIDVTIQSLKMLVTGGASVNDLSGPVGIVQSMGEVYEESVENDGYFYAFLNMMSWAIMLSANLGVMNLLPIPALDGGRLVFLFIEAIRGKALDPEKEGMVHMIGIILLFGLMFVVMFNDIRKIFV
ncbi:MAG: RIP metalloprotease RseP [Agathobacter sp.]|nr:RIP metalloprotease RseP [Agathobacter sp.]